MTKFSSGAETIEDIHVLGSYGFTPGMTIVIGGEPKPYGFMRRLWWHLRKDLGGPVLFVQPRKDGERATIATVGPDVLRVTREERP